MFYIVFIQAQGQTLQRMGLVLADKQCFSHGQLYVALSRVTSMEGIKIFSPNTCKAPGNNFIENVVYNELLDGRMNQFVAEVGPFEERHFDDNLEFDDDDELDDEHDYEMYP